MLKKFTYFLFYLILLSPVLSYFTLSVFHISSQYYMGVFISLLGMFYLIFKSIKIPNFAYFLLIYILYTLIWSFYTGEIDQRGYRVFSKNQLIHTFFAIILIYNTNFSEKFIKQVILLIKWTVIIATIVSILQVFNYSFMNANPIWVKGEMGNTLSDDLYNDRRMSIFGYIDPNEIGLSYIPLLSVLLGMLLNKRNRFYYVYIILGGISAFLSNGRYVIIGFIIITLQILFMYKVRIKGIFKYFFFILIFGVLLIQMLSSFGYNFYDWFNTRLLAEGSITETTRYKAIDNFLLFFPQHVLFGSGGPTEEITAASIAIGSSQIHVGYLAHLVYYGLSGSVLLFGFWFLLAKKLYRTAKTTSYWGSFLGFFIFLWANATLVTFHFFFYGIIFALIFDKYYSDKSRINLHYSA